RLLEGANAFVTGDAKVSARLPGAVGVAAAVGEAPGATSGVHAGAPPGAGMLDEGFGFETMFVAQAEPGKPLDVDAIRSHLESIGESVLVAGDARAIKVHIHNERPDQVLAYALGLGQLSKISVENLDQQASDVRETRAAAFASDGTGAVGGATGAVTATGDPGAHDVADNGSDGRVAAAALPLAVVAVAAGEGLAAIFRDFG